MHRPLCGRCIFSSSKNLVEFRRCSGERKSDHFLRRHVRRRKYFSACKRARCPPPADSACAAVRPQIPLSKSSTFLTVPNAPTALRPVHFLVLHTGMPCGIIKTDEAGTLDFSGVPAFLVTNAFIVQRSAAKMFNIVSGPQLLSIHQGFCDYRPGFQCPWTHGP